jgi:hypothetical protein
MPLCWSTCRQAVSNLPYCLVCAALQGEAGGGPAAAAAAAAAAGGRRSSSTPAGIKTAQRWTQEEHDLLLQVRKV